MASVQHIDDERSAGALADLLNGNARRRPVVVVTIPAGRSEPWINVEELAREAGNLAEIYLMPTGHFTWEFSRRMAEERRSTAGRGVYIPLATSGRRTFPGRRFGSLSTPRMANAPRSN